MINQPGPQLSGAGVLILSGLPFPPTMNHRHIPRGKRLILSPEYRAYKHALSLHLLIKFPGVRADEHKGKMLKVNVVYTGPRECWFTKADTIRVIDVDNRHKTLFDVVFPFLGLDDSQVFEMNVRKSIGGSEMTASLEIICA